MPITVTPTAIPDVLIIEPKVFGDDRGWFFESFNEKDFSTAVGHSVTFVQDNHSSSKKGVLRGLHYQMEQTQGKLVRVYDILARDTYDEGQLSNLVEKQLSMNRTLRKGRNV